VHQNDPHEQPALDIPPPTRGGLVGGERVSDAVLSANDPDPLPAPRRADGTPDPVPPRRTHPRNTPLPTARGAGPLSRYLLVLALIVVAAAIYLTADSPKQVPVYVAARDIPAYHHITAEDVTLSTRNADETAKYATSPIDGRLSLKPLAKDKPISAADIAPDVAKILGEDLVGLCHGPLPTRVFLCGKRVWQVGQVPINRASRACRRRSTA
jgi:hypothetical protein